MNTTRPRFPHQRLDAYRVALELYEGVERLAAGFPAGFADLKDQLRRSAGATVRNIAEGANRAAPRDKAARFTIARGEALRGQADRVAAMLRGLVRREEARAGPP